MTLKVIEKAMVALGAATLFFMAALAIGVIVYVTRQPIVTINSENGRPDTPCTSGLTVTTSDKASTWMTAHKMVGDSCKSTCHAATAKTTCNANQECVSPDPSTCHGFCLLDDTGDGPNVQSHPNCSDRLKFKDFFITNTPTSSAQFEDWLLYSDSAGYCDWYHGCTWAVSEIGIEYGGDGNWYQSESSFVACEDFLNMTNGTGNIGLASCIQSQEIIIDPLIATPVYKAIFFDEETPSTNFQFQSRICHYWYKCGLVNSTALTNPEYLQESLGKKKRSTTPLALPYQPSRETQRAIDYHLDRREDLVKQFGPQVAAFAARAKHRHQDQL